MKTKIWILGLICFFIYSCAVAPAPRQIKNTFFIEKSFDDVWTAVIETFAEMTLPIMNMEKDSGLITTDWIDFTGSKGKEYCDCGKLGINIEIKRIGKFNVFVKKLNNACEIRITCSYQQIYEPISFSGKAVSQYKRDCISTGKLEADMFNLIK
jgi:hypothetical protein